MPANILPSSKTPINFAIGLVMSMTANASMAESLALEEIVVTAQKRAQSLQDVPISILATSGESIAELGITRADEFTANLPAITIAQNPLGNFVFIRGVGSAGVNQGIEQSVAIFHDGIYMGRSQLSRAPFMDIERVEVLRGPQSILFGKNTIGGAMHVITAQPTEEFEGSVAGLYGEDGERELSAVLSGPLTDSLSARIALRDYQQDGYLENILTGQDGPERDDQTARLQLAWDASENLRIVGKWEHSSFEQGEQFTQLNIAQPTGNGIGFNQLNQGLVAVGSGGSGAESLDDERAVINDGGIVLGQVLPQFAGLPGFPDQEEGSDTDMDIGSLTINWDIGEHTLTAISGFANYELHDICDCDISALPLIEVDATEDYDQFSQEIRLASPGGETIDYIVGLYYQESDLQYRSIEAIGTSLASLLLDTPAAITPNLTRDYSFDQEQDTWSVFAQGTYNFTNATRAALGLRYLEESKTADHFLDKRFTAGWDYSAGLGLPAGTLAYGDTPAEYDRFLSDNAATPLPSITEGIYSTLLGTFEHNIVGRQRDESDWLWSLALQHDLNDDILAYVSAANGTKGGGFDARFLGTADNPFFEYDEETAISYELGLKSTLFDGRMTFNAAAFYSTVEDYQVSIFDGATAFFVQNAAELDSKGVEVDIRWAATEKLVVNFAGSYLKNDYAEFPNAPCWTLTASEPVNRGDCQNVGTPNAFRDAGGDTNQFSPEWAFNLGLDYRQPLGDSLEARGVLNINYSDEYFVAGDLDPVYALQPSFTTVDLRLSLGGVGDNWEIALIGKNLTDEQISGSSNDQPLVPGNGFAFTNRLRSYAIQGIYRF